MPDNISTNNPESSFFNHNPQSKKIPVVGIGASAGGLEAFKVFFEKMPVNTGMAFVMIPHLDPGHKSLMVEIIGRYTAMPVHQVENPMKIAPDHIYIVPPNRNLTIKGNELIPNEISRSRGINLPVDTFFRSLAVAQKERAIGIILSGTMRDGAMGLKDIKEHGGLVIAQVPETAQHDGMPQSAIDTGMVDFVLPIEDMPDAIIKFIAHPYIHGKKIMQEDEDELNQVLAVIRSRTRHDFRCYKHNTLVRRIERRMGLRQIEQMADYVGILKNNPEETDALLKDLLIGVTGFFREEQVWEKVKNEIIPPMIRNADADVSLRVWIPGCSTGEEAYTIALLIHDAFEKANKHFNAQIFATDIDGDAIATARKGVYPEAIAANVPKEYLKKYFTHEDGEYHILRRIRESVVFAEQNLVGDAPFSNLNMVSCRNLLIYLNSEVQRKIIELFHFSLMENGCLVLGNSETIGYHQDLFETVSKEYRIYRRIGQRADRLQIPLMKYTGRYPMNIAGDRMDLSRNNLSKLMQTQLLKQFAPAAVLIDKNYEILNLHGPTSQYLDLPQGNPVMELTSMVKEGLRLKLRAAIHKVTKMNEIITVQDARVKRDRRFFPVSFTVSPIREKNIPNVLFLITFQDQPVPDPETIHPVEPDLGEETLVRQLETELIDTREDLQNTIEELETSNEELKASNEEMMSMNEELQSSNEELETSKEELQSMNEELNTVNAELREKVQDLELANNDIANLMNSTEVATVFLDMNMEIRWFTPAAKHLFNLIPSDVGRPIGDLSMRFSDTDLQHDAAKVMETLAASVKEVETHEGSWYIRRILPFQTQDKRVDGLVLTFSDVTDLKEKEIAIRTSEEQLKENSQLLVAVLEHTYIMAAYLDPQFNFIWVNKAYAETCRHDPAFFPGKNHFDLYPHEENQAIFEQVVETGRPFFVAAKQFEFPDQPERGVTYWDWSLIPTKDSDGKVTGLVFTLVEVTNRISAEEKVRKSEERFRQLFENMSSGVAVFEAARNGTDFIFRDFNKAAEKIDRIDRDALIGKQVTDMFPGVVEFGLFDVFRRVWRTGVSEKVPTAFYKDGRIEGWRENNVYKLPTGELVAIYDDVTKRRQAEESLREREMQYRELVQNANSAIIRWKVDGTVAFFNEYAQDFFGYQEDEIIGKNVSILVPEENTSGQDLSSLVQDIVANPEGFINNVNENVRRDGRRVQMAWTNKAVLDKDGKLVEILAVGTDITERYRAEMLEESNRRLKDFVYAASHDLQEPLRKIQTFADRIVIKNSDTLDDKTRDSLDRLQKIAANMKDLILALLEYSRVTSSLEDFTKFNLGEPLQEAISDLSILIEEKEGQIEISDLPEIHADRAQMYQLLQNLISNSLKFSGPEKPVVRIHAENAAKGFLKIIIEDNGIGFNENYIDQIFKPFRRLHPKNSPYKGTGMGLAICLRIVERHRGTITVRSQPGNGTTFTVMLPEEQPVEGNRI